MSKLMVWKPVEPAIYALPDTYYRHMLIYEDVTEGHSVSFVTSLDVTPTDELNVWLGDYRLCHLVPASPDAAGDVPVVAMTAERIAALDFALDWLEDTYHGNENGFNHIHALHTLKDELRALLTELKGQGKR